MIAAGDELAQQHSYNRKVLLYTYCVLTLILLTALSADVIRQFFSEVRRDGQNTSTISELHVQCTLYQCTG